MKKVLAALIIGLICLSTVTILLAQSFTPPQGAWIAMKNIPYRTGAAYGSVYDGATSLYALAGSYPNICLLRYDISVNQWTFVANPPTTIWDGATLAYGDRNHLYVFRGRDSTGVGSTDFWRYDVSGNSWTDLASAPKGVWDGGALAYDGSGYIYALQGGIAYGERAGGWGGWGFWRYSISSNSWTVLPDAPNVCGAGGCLSCVAGYVYALEWNGFWRYSISANSWESRASTPNSASTRLVGWGGGLAYDGVGLMYALRGDDTKEFWAYSISSDSWDSLPDTPETVCTGSNCLAYANGFVYAIRGYALTRGLTQDFWRFGATTPPPQGVHDVAVTDVTPLSSTVPVGTSVQVLATAENLGDYTETFSITAYYGLQKTPCGGSCTVGVTLDPKGSKPVTLQWDTTGVAPGSYQIWAYASPVAGESILDNNWAYSQPVTINGLPYAPSNLVADPVDAFAIGCSLAIHLWWETPQHETYSLKGYKIYRGSSSTQRILITTVDSSKTDYLDHVGAKGIYYYDVVAMYAQGDSVPSNEATCAPMESFSGIENVVHLDSLNAGPGEWIPHVFTIQQNVKIPLFTSIVANWGYWVQNVIWIDPHEMWMGGSIQVFEIRDNKIARFPFAIFPQTYPVPYYRVGQFNSTVALRMTIDGDTLRIINPCNWQSFDLNLPVMGAGYHFLSVWTTSLREDAPFTTLVYNKSPELVVVNNPVDQLVPGSTGVHFGAGTSGSVDSYVRVDTASGSQWLWCTASGVVKWGAASTAEESIGLHWEASGPFTYDAAYDSKTSAEEGLWCWPNYYNTVADAPSITWAPGLASLSINVFCPAYLNLYDDQGRCVGYNATSGTIETQIDNAIWLSNQTILIFNPSGTYSLEVTGTGNGTFASEISWQDVTGATCVISNSTSTITENETQVYVVGADANVTLTNILPSKTVVGQGFTLQVNATVADLGGPNATFDVSLYTNGTLKGTQSALNVSGWNSTNVCFTCNTTGLAYGNYTLSANIQPANNNFTGGVITVTIPGDINGDFTVDVYDALTLAGAYNSKPNSPNWNLNADINGDNMADIYDAIILANHFNEYCP